MTSGIPRLLAIAFALCAAAPATAQRTLEYRLRVGDRLVLACQTTQEALDGRAAPQSHSQEVQFWVLAQQDNELLILVQSRPAGSIEPADLNGGVLYIGAAGQRRFPEPMITRYDALEPALALLPVLPFGAQLENEWRTPPDPYGRRWHCVQRGGAQGGLIALDFTLEDDLGVTAALGQSCRGRFWFDPAAGLVTRFEATAEDRARGMRTQLVGTLQERIEQSPGWCMARAGEAQRYLRALALEDQLLHDVATHPDDLPRLRAELDRVWLAFASDVDQRALSPFAPLADAHRTRLRAAGPALAARSTLARRWIDRRARPWTLLNERGETVICEHARPGVTIELYWAGESVASLRALESIRRLQAALTHPEIRVLCFNLDAAPETARALIAQCGGPGQATGRQPPQPLTHLLGGPLREVETFPELPVVRVLDRAGIVRDLWLGWHPDYAPARELAERLAREPR